MAHAGLSALQWIPVQVTLRYTKTIQQSADLEQEGNREIKKRQFYMEIRRFPFSYDKGWSLRRTPGDG